MSGAGFDESIWVGVVSVLLLTVVSFMVILVRMMVIGQGSGMSPDRFVLYGIPDGRLQTGIYLASLAGPASVFGLVCLLAVVPLYREPGCRTHAGGCPGCRAGPGGASGAFTRLHGPGDHPGCFQEGEVRVLPDSFAFSFLICPLPPMITSEASFRGPDADGPVNGIGYPGLDPTGGGFPLASGWYGGSWPSFLGRVVIALVTLVLCGLAGIRCLRHT